MRKIISLSSYLAFFGSGCFSVGLQEENNTFCHEMLGGFTEEIRRPLDQVEMCWRNLSTLDTDRYKAMGALIATGLFTYTSIVLGTNLASMGTLTPLAIPALIVGNIALALSSIMNVTSDEEINTASKGVGIGAAKGILLGLPAVMVGEISHFAPLVNKHEQHSAVLNNEHEYKHEQHSAVLNNEHEYNHEQHPAVLKVDPKKDIDPYYVPVNPNISVVSKYDQHDVDFDKLAKSFNAMEEVYEAHKFKNINDYGLNASNIIEDALKTTKNPSIICELQKMRDDLHDINQALLNAIPNDQQTVYVIPPTATEHAHISFTLNSQEVISTNENIKNLNSLKNIFREYIQMYNSHTYPDIMQHGEKARDLIEAALRIGHNPYINLIQSIIYNDVCDVLSNEARLSSR